jgi:RNA polymerase sigma-70 factor (family 1)
LPGDIINIENSLLRKVASGNEVAFKELYNTWQPALSVFIYKITRSKELTAEIVQDVFLKIWMSREALEEVENFKSYLFVVCRNHAINAFRKAMRELDHYRQFENSVRSEKKSAEEDDDLFVLNIIDEAIDSLTPRQKEVYLLHRHQRLTYQQIADKLNIGRESVKTHIELAVRSITKHLKDRILVSFILVDFFSNNI